MSLLETENRTATHRAFVRLLRVGWPNETEAERALTAALARAGIDRLPSEARDLVGFAAAFVTPSLRRTVEPTLLRGLLEELAREAELDAERAPPTRPNPLAADRTTKRLTRKKSGADTQPAPPEREVALAFAPEPDESPLSIADRKPAKFPRPGEPVAARAPRTAPTEPALAKVSPKGKATEPAIPALKRRASAPATPRASQPAISVESRASGASGPGSRRNTQPAAPAARKAPQGSQPPSTRRNSNATAPASKRTGVKTVPAKKTKAAARLPGEKAAVALFDPDRFARASTARALLQAQIDVTAVETLKELIQLARGAERIDAVVVDADADGLELGLASLDGARPGVAVLAITRGARVAAETMLDRAGIRNASAIGRAARPAELVGALRRLLED
jgi:hypothetical protein